MGEFAETTRYRFSALAQTIGTVRPGDMVGGMKAAKSMMTEMEGTSQKLGVNFKDLANIMPQLAMQAQSSGVGFNTIKKLFTELAPAAKLQGMSLETLGMNLQSAFAGRAPVQLRMLLSTLGMGGEQLKMLTRIGATGNVKALISMMQSGISNKAVTNMSKMWSSSSMANMERMKNSISKIYMTIGNIVMERLDIYFERADKWITANKVKIDRIAKVIGSDVVVGMKKLVQILGFVQDHWKAILYTVLAVKGASMASSLVGGVSGIIGGGIKIASALGFAGQYGSLGGGFAGLLGMVGKNVVMFGTLAAAGWAAYEVIKAISILKTTSNIKKATQAQAIETTKHITTDISNYLTKFQRLGMIGTAQKSNLTKMIEGSGLSKAIQKQMIGTLNMLKTVKGAVGVEAKEAPKEKHQTHIHIGHINITQDFKGDALPDKVLLRFQADLEKLAEKQRISNVSPVFGAT
jgi:hypothetical protein